MYSLAVFSNMFGPDTLIIFLFLLLFFGAKKLPELARGLGSAMREFSKAKDEIQHEITRPPTAPTPQIESPRGTETYASTEEDYHQVRQAPAVEAEAKPTAVPSAMPAAEPTPRPPTSQTV